MNPINNRKKLPVIHYPQELEDQNFLGKLYGYYHSDSNEYNVISYAEKLHEINTVPNLTEIGEIVHSLESYHVKNSDYIVGLRTEKGLIFRAGERLCRKEPYNLITNIFSRNTGILETNVMLNKCAIISGCGSVGSLVALELARAGVGIFVLIDNDTIAYHNLCRHQCGVLDVGKFKVNAVKEKILQINPTAKVVVYSEIIERVNKKVFDEFCQENAIIIGCADNREGDLRASEISCLYHVPFVSIGLWQRAFAGEIFYSLPGSMPCYICPFGNRESSISNRNSTNRRFYLSEEQEVKNNFEPGISIDINFVTLIATKLIIDIINRDTPNYIAKVINHLSQFTLVCNTPDPRIGGEQAEIFSHPLQITTSIGVDYVEPCPPCKFLT